MNHEVNDWFLSLPEGRQKVLKDDKWMLADNAYRHGVEVGMQSKQAEIDQLKESWPCSKRASC
jgi:hypothetical protein